MKTLYVNNYSKIRGGAEASILNTYNLFKGRKNKASLFTADKLFIKNNNSFQKINNFIYSARAKKEIINKINDFKPDIVHLNNIYHHLSPSIIDGIKKTNLPIILSLRDYKLICARYKLYRNGKICEECKNKNYLSILKNNCNLKGNFGESILLWLEMNLHHNVLH
ncbi:glycosyltransferase family 1 protein, partial [Patescibacteria group bacterium]